MIPKRIIKTSLGSNIIAKYIWEKKCHEIKCKKSLISYKVYGRTIHQLSCFVKHPERIWWCADFDYF